MERGIQGVHRDGETRLGYAGFEVSEMRGDDAFKL